MRLGLLGPAGGDVAALGRAAEFLLNGARVHRAIYLGNDNALDRAVAAWARSLVGDDPTDDGAWRRATELALSGSPEAIDRFVVTERARQRLKSLEALPEEVARTIEMVASRVAILVYDRSQLEEEDIRTANILLYGKSDEPLVTREGSRWFVTPGTVSSGGGIAVLDDEQDDVVVTFFDVSGKVKWREVLSVQRTVPRGVERLREDGAGER